MSSGDIYALPEGVESFDDLVYLLDRRQAQRYVLVASYLVIIYEYIITFDQEIQFIWKTRPRISWTKLLFLEVRYLPLILMAVWCWCVMAPGVPQNVCDVGVGFVTWCGMFAISAVDAILGLRIWFLYARSKILLGFFALVMTISFAIAIPVIYAPLPPFQFLAPTAPRSITGCVATKPNEYFALLLIVFCIDFILFSLLVRKAWIHHTGPFKAPLVSALIQHGAIYYGVAFLTLILSAIAPFVRYLADPFMYSELTMTMSSVACVRLVYSLRSVKTNIDSLGTSSSSTPLESTQVTSRTGRARRSEPIELDLMMSPLSRVDIKTPRRPRVLIPEDDLDRDHRAVMEETQ